MEEGQRLDFETPMPIFNARAAPPGVDATCGDVSMNKENVDINAGAAVASASHSREDPEERSQGRCSRRRSATRSDMSVTPTRGDQGGEDFMTVDGDDEY